MIPVKLKTLTPVHIGSGRELSRDVEFLHMKNRIGVIDEKKILQLIGEENVGLWVSMIEKGEPLLGYLQKRNPALKLSQVSSRTMPLYATNFNRVKTLKEQLIDGMGHPLIPGSSIKGAIRTAILNILLKELNHNWKEHELKNTKGKFSDKNILSRIFGNDPNHDFMRFLKIGDALFEPQSLLAMSVLSMNYLFDRTKRDEKFLLLTEAIATEEETSIRLKLDVDHWKKNIEANEIRQSIPEFMHDYESLFQAINSFTELLIKTEINKWESDKFSHKEVIQDYIQDLKRILNNCYECSQKETVLRLGHGSGWIFMTGGWINNEDFISQNVKDQIINQTRPGNNRYADYFFPKTRRMDEDGELMGFVKLSLEN